MAGPPLLEAIWMQKVFAGGNPDNRLKELKLFHADDAASLLVLVLHTLVIKQLIVLLLVYR